MNDLNLTDEQAHKLIGRDDLPPNIQGEVNAYVLSLQMQQEFERTKLNE